MKKDIGIMLLEGETAAGRVPPLRRLGLTVNYACDGNCTYCYAKPQWHAAHGAGNEMTLDEFREILRQARPLGLEEVQLSGGEPLLKKDVLDFVKMAKDSGVRVGIFTNGSTLGKMLEGLKAARADWIRVSLGGSTAEKSRHAGRVGDTDERFARILDNIRASVEAGFVTGTFTPVMKKSYADVRATAALARDLGAKYIVFCNYIPLGNEQDEANRMDVREHYEAIEEVLKAREDQRGALDVLAYYGFFEYLSPNWKETDEVLKGPCGRERLAFDANGDVKTCLCTGHALDSFRKKGFNLAKMWREHPTLLEIRKNKKFEPCLHCKRNAACRPCLVPTIHLSKTIDAAPPNCPAVREYTLFKKTLPEKEALEKALRHNLKQGS